MKRILTNLLTPCSRVQLVKKFPAFYGIRRFITAFTSARHLSLSWASSIQSIQPHPTSWRSSLILSSHLYLGHPSGLFPSGFPTKNLYTPFLSPPPSHYNFITQTTGPNTEQYIILIYQFCMHKIKNYIMRSMMLTFSWLHFIYTTLFTACVFTCILTANIKVTDPEKSVPEPCNDVTCVWKIHVHNTCLIENIISCTTFHLTFSIDQVHSWG